MLDNARKIPCEMLLNPTDPKYAENIRLYQGCPTVAATRGGRIFLGWYAGGTREPHMDNYNVLVKSDDGGKTFGEPILIIPSNKETLVHALDIQLWVSPKNELWVIWTQNNVEVSTDGVRPEGLHPDCPWVSVEGYDFPDFEHASWVSVCKDPDAKELVFEKPRYFGRGFLRCKPTVLSSGRWLFFNYDQLSDRYSYSISDDGGKNFIRKYGAKKCPTQFDEGMAYERTDGSVRMLARAHGGKIAECVSVDGGDSWSCAALTDIPNPDTRFYISRTPSGRVILVNNHAEKGRTDMTVYLSEDDGVSWKYKCTVDPRVSSYPDVDFYGDRIYLIYDHERIGEREILFLDFTEEDIINGSRTFVPKIISKP